MLNDHAPRMSSSDYFSCLNRAALAARAEDVERLRTEVIERWRGDPRAQDLAEALYTHQVRLAGREDAMRQHVTRIANHLGRRSRSEIA